MHFFWVGHFEFFLKKKNFFAFFPWKLVKVYWLARMGQNFDQVKRDNTFWPMPNILKGSVKRERIFATDILVSKYLLDDLIKKTQ